MATEQEQSFEDAFNEFVGGGAPAPAEPPLPDDAADSAQDAPLAQTHEDSSAPADAAAEPAAEDKPPTFDDLLAALPQGQAERYRPLLESASKEIHRLRSDAGRVSAMQHLYHEAKARAESEAKRAEEAEARRKDLESRAAQPMDKVERVAFDADADDFAKEFPEFSNAVNMRVENLLKKHLQQSQQPPVAPAAAQATPQGQQQVAQAAPAADARVEGLSQEYAALAAAHPDWQQASASPAFQSWKAAQGADVQRMLGSDYAGDAIRVLDRFKSDLAVSRRRQELTRHTENRRRLEQNVSIKGAPARPEAIPDEFEAAFDYYVRRDERRQARA